MRFLWQYRSAHRFHQIFSLIITRDIQMHSAIAIAGVCKENFWKQIITKTQFRALCCRPTVLI